MIKSRHHFEEILSRAECDVLALTWSPGLHSYN